MPCLITFIVDPTFSSPVAISPLPWDPRIFQDIQSLFPTFACVSSSRGFLSEQNAPRVSPEVISSKKGEIWKCGGGRNHISFWVISLSSEFCQCERFGPCGWSKFALPFGGPVFLNLVRKHSSAASRNSFGQLLVSLNHVLC